MASNEKYCLRWNDFESNISTAFRELRDEKDFFDVTLACDDNQVQAHKVILSACSPFFRSILRRNPHQHPLLYLRGVKYSELVNVLNFMYQGEVNVAQEELNDFLGVAEDLRVKGLTQGKQNGEKSAKSEPPSHQERSSKDSHIDTGPPPKRKRPSPAPAPRPPPPSAPRVGDSYRHPEGEGDDIQEVMPTVKTEPMAMAITQSVVPDDDPIQDSSGQEMALQGHYDESYDGFQYEDGGDQTYDESQMMDASMGDGTVEGNKGYTGYTPESRAQMEVFVARSQDEFGKRFVSCKICNKSYPSKDITNLRRHLESKHLGVGFTCEVCGNTLTNRESFRRHLENHYRMPHLDT